MKKIFLSIIFKPGKYSWKYGKGTVFAVGDPWLYNEYTDGRKLPADFQNNVAARELIKWAIKQTK